MPDSDVVMVNGTFDVLHIGHVRLLEYAKSLGRILVVAIDSDSRVRKLKGQDRPINNHNDRAEMLLSLRYVDQVRVFGSDEELEYLIKAINPKILVIGSDWKGKRIVGEEYAKDDRLMVEDISQGSAIVIDNDKILTCQHVVKHNKTFYTQNKKIGRAHV